MKTYLDEETRKKDEGPPSSYTPRSEMPEDEPGSGQEPEFYVPEKCSVIEQLRISITRPKQLVGLSLLKVSRFIRYALLLGLLVTIMTYIVPTAATIAGFGGFNKLFQEKMPDFKVENGEFKAQDTFSLSLGDYEIIVDTSENVVSTDKYLGKLLTIAIGKKRVQIAMSQNGITEVVIDQAVSSYFSDGFNKEMLVSAIPGFYIALGFIALITLIGVLLKYMAASLIYMILAWSLVKHSGLDLNKGNCFRLCFYAQTIGILAVNLNKALGYMIPSLIVSAAGIFLSLRWIAKSMEPYIFNKGQAPI